MKNNFAETLKEMRIRAGYSQKEVYEMFNIRQSTFSAWETGRAEPSADMLLKLCKLYNINDIFAAFGYDGYKEDGSIQLNIKEIEHIEKYRSLDLYGQETVSYILDREVKRVKELADQKRRIEESEKSISADEHPVRVINYYYRLASAGTGQIIFDMPPTKRIEIPDIQKYRKADYAIGVNGSSMEPAYSDGDTLLVEMTDHISFGEVGIFSVDGECYVKELGDGELKSLNPASKNIPLNETAHCMGRVIGKL